MNMARSRRAGRIGVGLLAAMYVVTALMPASVAATPHSVDPATPAPAAETTPDATSKLTPEPTPTPAEESTTTQESTLTPDPTPTATPTATPEPATEAYIVTFSSGIAAGTQDAILASVGAVETGSIPRLRMRAILLAPSSLAEALAALADDPRVARVDADRVRIAEEAPTDPSYGAQWALPKIGWDDAHDSYPAIGGAVVAVLDTGVDANHSDLDDAIVPGASIVDGSTWSADPSGHGTAMAGIVAAETGNGEGIAGVGYDGVQVMPVTVLGPDGTGQDSDVIAGVVWAVDHGAHVILMAFSSGSYSASLQAALDYAWSNGVVLVAAAGNDDSSAGAFPAGDRGVIGVSNTTRSDTLAAGSNFGPSVFLGAPGVAIYTTAEGGGYRYVSGTSASAAMVAGAAAALRAVDPSASNGVVVGRLARSADPAGTRDETGNGRVNLERALGDTSTEAIQPAGSTPLGGSGPFVGPYRAAAPGLFSNNVDIGTVSAAGSASYSGGTYTVNGSGADIFGTTDEFHFVYTQFTGDGTITARVASITNTSAYAKAGVMFRESLNGNSRNAFMSMTYNSDGAVYQWRAATGGTTTTSATLVATPYWVRLTRVGNLFTAYRSSSGSTWVQQGSSQTITMAATVYVGLAVSAVNDGAINTSTFTNVTMPGLNTAPVLTTTVIPLAYTENATTAIDPGITVTDTNGGNLASAQVFVNSGYVAGQDVLGFTNQNGISGSYSGGILTLTGTASVANYQTALRTVTYHNTSDAPSTGNRQIGFLVNDGAADSNAAFRTITITTVNDAPVVTATVANLAYTENATTVLDAGITATDVDSANLASAAVSVTTNYQNGQDVLAFTNQNGIVGTWTAATGILTLVGSATVANYQTALRSITYTNTSDAPNTATRTVTFAVNDGTAASNTASRQITITAVNDAPVLTTTVANLTYTENATTALDAGITVIDVDSSNLSSATVTMTTSYQNGQDTLAFSNQNGIVGTWTAATGVLALSGSATVANYQTALRSITYTNTSDAPVTTARTVSFVANDGTANSTPTTRNITIAAVNDGPLNGVPGGQSMVMNQRLTFSSASGNRISLSDVDAGASPVQVQLTATNGTLTLPAVSGLTFSVGDGTSDSTMTFTGTLANVGNALAWIVYDPTSGYAGSASLQIVASDQGNTGSGGALGDTDSVSISVRDLGIFTASIDVMVPSVRTASIPAGTNPYGVETNPTTNRIYVSSFNAGTVSVIDGATETVTGTVTVGVGPMGLAVNSVTNRIYVPNNGVGGNGTTVSVIDGATNTVIATIGGMTGPRYVAINEATNTIYVTNNGGTTVKIIDGATNTVSGTITLAGVPIGVAVNPVTNRVYVTYGGTPGRLAVYDGATNGLITTITTGNTPWAAAVNANMNKVYVTNFASNSISVVSGASNTVVATIATANWPTGIKLDPASNRVYVTEFLSDSMAVFDGATDTVLARLATGAGPTDLAVNPATDRVFVGSYTTSAVRVFQDGQSFAGTSSYSSSTYTVAGAGTGMVSTIDEFQFLHRTMTGNGRLTARTSSITNTAPGASAGLMMRDTLIAVVPFVMVSNTGAGSNAVRQTHRTTFGGASTTATVAGAAVPQYLRITRVGNVFTTEYSANGTSWTQAGAPQTIAMSATISVGIAVTSETASALNTSTLDSVGLNLAPVAVADPSYTVAEDGSLTQPAAGGVLTNDSDPEAATMMAVLVSGTSGLTLNSDGSFSYVPPAHFNGVATFTYKANDGVLDSNTVTATITVTGVNDVPSFTKGANQSVSQGATAQSVSGWATAISAGPADESSQVIDFIVTNDFNSLFTVQPAIDATGTLTYTPAAGATGIATVTVRIHDNGGTSNGGLDTSAAQTFLITVSDGAYVSSVGWLPSFDSSRYLRLTFPAYVAGGSVVTSATFRHLYRSATAGHTTCYYFEVYSGATLLATHGSAGTPLSCNATTSYASDAVALPEVDTVAEANTVSIKLFVRNSGGMPSLHRTATLGVTSSLD
jgi:YVTN family beta-propeller protein